MHQTVEELRADDLRDERIRVSARALDFNSVWGGGWVSRIMLLALGAAAAVGALEALSFIGGHGEFIGRLLN